MNGLLQCFTNWLDCQLGTLTVNCYKYYRCPWLRSFYTMVFLICVLALLHILTFVLNCCIHILSCSPCNKLNLVVIH